MLKYCLNLTPKGVMKIKLFYSKVSAMGGVLQQDIWDAWKSLSLQDHNPKSI